MSRLNIVKSILQVGITVIKYAVQKGEYFVLEFYWRKYVDAKVAQEYYLAYSAQSRWIEWVLNALCLIAACSGLAAIFSSAPVLGVVLTVAAQIVCALQPILPYGRRREISGFVYKEYTSLVARAERNLYRAIQGDQSEDRLSGELARLEEGMEAIEDKFSTADIFPRSRRLHNQAEKAAMQYLDVHFALEG